MAGEFAGSFMTGLVNGITTYNKIESDRGTLERYQTELKRLQKQQTTEDRLQKVAKTLDLKDPSKAFGQLIDAGQPLDVAVDTAAKLKKLTNETAGAMDLSGILGKGFENVTKEGLSALNTATWIKKRVEGAEYSILKDSFFPFLSAAQKSLASKHTKSAFLEPVINDAGEVEDVLIQVGGKFFGKDGLEIKKEELSPTIDPETKSEKKAGIISKAFQAIKAGFTSEEAQKSLGGLGTINQDMLNRGLQSLKEQAGVAVKNRKKTERAKTVKAKDIVGL